MLSHKVRLFGLLLMISFVACKRSGDPKVYPHYNDTEYYQPRMDAFQAAQDSMGLAYHLALVRGDSTLINEHEFVLFSEIRDLDGDGIPDTIRAFIHEASEYYKPFGPRNLTLSVNGRYMYDRVSRFSPALRIVDIDTSDRFHEIAIPAREIEDRQIRFYMFDHDSVRFIGSASLDILMDEILILRGQGEIESRSQVTSIYKLDKHHNLVCLDCPGC